MSADSVYVDPGVRKVIGLYAGVFNDEFYQMPVIRQLEFQADRLTEAHRHRDDAVCFQIGSWHPGLVGQPDVQILDYKFSIDDGRTTIAREYGSKDWVEAGANCLRRSDVTFEEAVNAMLSGDLSRLKGLLERTPGLLTARSAYGHHASLLHFAGTNGAESYRQVVPLNLAAIVDFLIASGADPASSADIYGGSTPRQLFETSSHSLASHVYSDVIAVFNKYQTPPTQ